MTALVVGGGVIGLAAAFELLSRGVETTVVDPRPGQGAAVASGGLFTLADTDSENVENFHAEAVRGFPGFVDRVGSAAGTTVAVRPALLRVSTAEQDPVLDRAAESAARAGLDCRPLTATECRDLFPGLSSSVVRGVRTTGEGTVVADEYLAALSAAVTALGGTICPDSVRAVDVVGGRVRGVHLVRGDYLPADVVVLCTGAAVSTIAGLPDGLAGQVVPVRGMTLDVVGEDVPPLPVLGTDPAASCGLLPLGGNRMRVGATSAWAGWSPSPTIGETCSLLDQARRLMPGLGELSVARHVVGYRPFLPGGRPFLGGYGADGLFLATGHYRSGVALSGLSASVLAGLVLGEPVPPRHRWLTAA